MKVSVIVPVYNVESYLEKCLHSLVNQSLQEIEIIVVNDGCSDNSQVIINDFANRFSPKIKSFIKVNGGLSDARNFGIDHCAGEYIGFVDGDDYVEENMFSDMYELAKKYDAELVICNLQKVDENGNITQKLTQVPNMPEKIVLDENFSVFSDLSYFACNKLFKKELFANKRFKKGVHFEDIQLIPQLLLECKVLAQTQVFHYNYVERRDSITKTHTERGLDILRAVEDVEKAFSSSQYYNRNKELRDFQILEGVYTYLAYLAFVKNAETYHEMSEQLISFLNERRITKSELLRYRRCGKNYLLSLPLRKKIYYLLYFLGQYKLLRKLA